MNANVSVKLSAVTHSIKYIVKFWDRPPSLGAGRQRCFAFIVVESQWAYRMSSDVTCIDITRS